MLNARHAVLTPPSQVIDYQSEDLAEAMRSGRMNTDEPTLLEHVQSSIRRGYPQMRQGPPRPDRIVLVGSGPSLHETHEALQQLVWEGATLVTMNGGYHWCLQHGLRPQTQIVMDARPQNVRFLQPDVPRCNYLLASQCHPDLWDAVQGRQHVWIWHPVAKADGPVSEALDRYYHGRWMAVGGGVTVATRAIMVLVQAGYRRFDLFGVDSCWKQDQHHALDQPENAGDKKFRAFVGSVHRPGTTPFLCSPWHVKQVEDVLTLMKLNGQHFQLEVHGPGLLGHVLRVMAEDPDASFTTEEIT